VATTERPDDDLVAETARHVGAAVVRGDVDDVLARFMGVIRAHPCDLVVRLTGDNPLVGGDFIDFVIDAHIAQTPAVAYTDTTTSRTFPYGLSVEIVAPEALEAAHREATSSVDREHVTSFVRDRPERFPSLALRCEDDGSALRWTVDTAGDLANVREVFRRWSPDPRRFGWRELLRRERAFARARGGT
jgi:spore coat polysaccharide biosynthesis protein SpsF (cytidylyltransferase family)